VSELHKFMVRVNDGEPVEFLSKHSEYSIAALDAFGKLDLDYRSMIDIWVPDLVEHGYGPFRYIFTDFVDWRGNEYGVPSVCQCRPVQKPTVTQ
jgi:hypothetical protein